MQRAMPAILTSPALHEATVIAHREAAPGIIILQCDAPHVARATRPGQFVMAVTPGGERAATALGVYESQDDRISLMIVICGPRTRELAGLRPGGRLRMLGPLGNGFDLEALGDDVTIVAGGVGLASLFLAARALCARGIRVRVLYGARTAAALVDIEKLTEFGIEVAAATDDGSFGHRGYVTDLLASSGRIPSGIVACGPTPMLRAVASIAARLGIPAQLSLEETFACGVGACWGCVVPHAADAAGTALGLIGAPAASPPAAVPGCTPGGEAYTYVRVCKEGPVFWARELRW
jgi:dihydroorotate dehydrogenase electron transfer subunit